MPAKKPTTKKSVTIEETPSASNHVVVKVKNTELLKIVTNEMDDLPADVVQVRESQQAADYKIVTKNPHGYAYITGPDVPKELHGAFTSYILAEEALKRWFASGRNKKG
jgi:hypothetical protein